MKTNPKLATNQILVEKMIYGGYGLAKTDGKTYIIEGNMVPGDRIEYEILQEKPDFVRCRATAVIEKSVDRVESICPIDSECGGCQFLVLPYEKQISIKRKILRESLERIGKIRYPKFSVLPTPSNIHYRNTVTFHVAYEENAINVGHYKTQSHTVVPTPRCLIVEDPINIVHEALVRLLNSDPFLESFQTIHRDQGIDLVSIKYRVSHSTKEVMVVFGIAIPKQSSKPNLSTIVTYATVLSKTIQETCPSLQSAVVETLDPKGIKPTLVLGKSYLTDHYQNQPPVKKVKRKPITYYIGNQGFYQTNSFQFPILYNTIASYIPHAATPSPSNLTKDSDLKNPLDTVQSSTQESIVVDLFSGAATIAIWIAHLCKHVYAIEKDIEAFEIAKKNILTNQVKNITLIKKEVEKGIDYLIEKGIQANIIVMDPPRVGCSKGLLTKIHAMSVDQVIYVSCNPSTFARDAAILTKLGFELSELHLADMFPQTYHIECLGIFKRNP